MEGKQEIKLEIRPEIARGTYSNLAIISHSHSEFVIDFATILPGLDKPDISNRILMTPEHAKRLLNALNTNRNSVSSSSEADSRRATGHSTSVTCLTSALTELNHNLR